MPYISAFRPILKKHRQGEHTIIRFKEHSMEEHKMNNHKVLVNLAKDPSSSHFSGNECIYIGLPQRPVSQASLYTLYQRFSTGGTRTTGGTPDVSKWYAKK